MSRQIDKIISYYNTRESRWGYKLLLGGTKHFGYYPKGQESISMRKAMVNMMDKLGETLQLSSDSKVLDAGCGEGTTALHIAEKYNLNVEGIDLLDFNIKRAKTRLSTSKTSVAVNFSLGNYMKLKFSDNYFDGVYTLETLVHASDYKKALTEFRRVLKKNGKLVLFEYSMPNRQDETDDEAARLFGLINEGSGMHSLPMFTHGIFPQILQEAGFKDVKVKEITPKIMPMVKRFWQIGVIPYQFIKLFNKEMKFVNTTSGVALWKYRNYFRYNIITATKA